MKALSNLLEKRPLAASLSLFLAANFLIQFLRPSLFLLLLIILPTAAVCLYLFVLSFRRRGFSPYRTALILLLSALMLALAVGGGNNAERQTLKRTFRDTEIAATFRTERIRETNGATLVTGTLTPENENHSYKTRLTFFDGDTLLILENDRYLPLAEGDVFTGYFKLSATDGNTLEELSSYADGYRLEGSYLHSAELIEHKAYDLSIRSRLAELLDTSLSESAAAITKALLLGDKNGLSPTVKSSFSTLGVSHLFAVSGLHLTVTVGLLAYLLARLSISKKLRYPLLVGVILFYAFLTDFTPSLLRAGGMLLLFYLSDFVGRSRDSVTALLAATATITLISRSAILDVGLLLSFLATLGILTVGLPTLSQARPKHRVDEDMGVVKRLCLRLVQALLPTTLLTLSAITFLLPIQLLLSGSMFLLAPLSNLLFTPLFTLALYLIPLFLLTCQIPLVGGIVILGIELITQAILSLSHLAAPLTIFNLSLEYRFAPYLILAILAVTVAFLLGDRKKLALLTLSSLLVLMPIGATIDTLALQNTENVGYLSDGTNDLLLVEYERNRLVIAFSYSDSFITKGVDSGRLTSPAVSSDTLMLPEPTETETPLIDELWQTGSLSHLILPQNSTATESLATYAEGLGIKVTLYTPNDTLVYNGITVRTHASTAEKTYAISITLQSKSVLYIRENAPNDFDIRFGVLSEQHSILIRGAYGGEMKGSLSVLADEIWEYESKGYVSVKKGQTRRLGERAISEKRK